MRTFFSPLQLLSVALAGWMNRHQQAVIDYLVAENQLLKEQVDGRQLQLTDNQRRRLAAKAHDLGHVPQGPLGTTRRYRLFHR